MASNDLNNTNENFYYMASTSNSSTNFNWINNNPKNGNENFYENVAENGFPNNTNAKNNTNNGESAILQGDPILYNTIQKQFDDDFGQANTIPQSATTTTTTTPASSANNYFESEHDDNPFVNIVMKSESSDSNNYNPNKYYDSTNNYTAYNNGVSLGLDAAVNDYDVINKDEYSLGYSEQNDESLSQIVNTQEFMLGQGPQTADSNETNKKRKQSPLGMGPKKKGRPFKDPNTPRKEKDPNKPEVKKGRPKGPPKGPPKPRSSATPNGRFKNKTQENGEPLPLSKRVIPKMSKKVLTKKLLPTQIEESKKSQKPFLQPGVCYQIAPNLDHCLECASMKYPHWRARREGKKDIDCRFFEFRKLVYTPEGDLKVHGFLDPYEDPAEVDHNIWLPLDRHVRSVKFTIHQCRLVLSHIGESFCDLLMKEQEYLSKYKKGDDHPMWKRLIWGVREICDLCSTTLFNHHFICTRCGFSCCIDCYEEHKEDNQNFEFPCSEKKKKPTHDHVDLMFTQTFTGDALTEIQRKFHEICWIWDIKHNCEFMKDVKVEDMTVFHYARNNIEEQKSKKNVLSREPLDPINVTEIDKEFFKRLHLEETTTTTEDNKNIFDDMNDKGKDILEHNANIRAKYHNIDYQKSLCYIKDGMEFVKNPSRILNCSTSQLLYPEVKHTWMCDGRLLRLLEPNDPENEEIFHDQWERGQPMIISGVHNNMNPDLWIPQSFSDEFGHEKMDLINCMNGNMVQDQPISVFWDGFEMIKNRLKDRQGTGMLLKLKDWPPDDDFAKIMPSRFEDIMRAFPMNSYTNRNGELNLVKYLPTTFVMPDLGPKMYNAYGSPYHLSKGTTNLHLDVSDAANVLVYVGIPHDEDNIKELLQMTYKAICEADCDIGNMKRIFEEGDIAGALWHIFEANDSDKIRDFLIKVAEERSMKIEEHHDPIHDQNWYLDTPLRKRLFEEYGVKGYAFVQCLGDAVFIPAGTPHQVRNIYSCIKVAEDFVSPENISHCLHLSQEFRKLTKTHTNNEDKLQIKSVIYHTVKEVINHLSHFATKRYIKTVENVDITKKDAKKEDSSSENLEIKQDSSENLEIKKEFSETIEIKQEFLESMEIKQEFPESMEIKQEILDVNQTNGANGIDYSNTTVKLDPTTSNATQGSIGNISSTIPLPNTFTFLNNGEPSSIQFMANNIVTVTNSLIITPQIPGNGQ